MKEKKDPSLPSEGYRARAKQCWQGALWFVALGLYAGGSILWLGLALIAGGLVFLVTGTVLYVFAHQARMLEAQDAVNALPKQSVPAP